MTWQTIVGQYLLREISLRTNESLEDGSTYEVAKVRRIDDCSDFHAHILYLTVPFRQEAVRSGWLTPKPALFGGLPARFFVLSAEVTILM